MDDPGRKRPKLQPIFYSGNRSPIIFMTVCTKNRAKILATPAGHDALTESWRQAGDFSVGRYVILPDHVHFFCSPSNWESRPLANWVRYWKTLFVRAFPAAEHTPLWQSGFWDTQLRQGESYRAKWDYVRHNPVRHGYVKDADAWPYQGEMNILPWPDR